MSKQSEQNSDYSGLEELLNAEVMTRYNRFIVDKAMRHAQGAKSVVDFGAGIGTLSLIFRDHYALEPICVEIDEQNKAYLTKRGFEVLDQMPSGHKADLIFSSNVLEHIEDDVAILEMMKDHLADRGKIYLYLPAKMLLWSKLDEEVGHYRRYEYAELKDKCQRAGLEIEALHFADSVGFFASLAMKLMGYNKDGGIGSVSSLKVYDKWLLPISKVMDAIGFRYLFGKNIVLVARKP